VSSSSGRSHVLVIGDANPDLVLRGDVVPRFGQEEQLVDDASVVIGGSAAITAHGLARLGRPVSLLAAVGDDALGRELRARLDGAGVDVSTMHLRAGRATGLSVLLSRGDDRAILTHLGVIDSLDASEVLTALEHDAVRHLHVASLFLQPGLAADLPEVLRTARESGITTSLDTNDDPRGRWEGVDALLPLVDVLLPNRREAKALAREDDARAAAAILASRGPMVAVKDGADGAFVVSPDREVVACGGLRREPVDTTGAGDTFDAAFLDGWLAGCPLSDVLRRAVVASALSVSAAGGTAGQPTREQLDQAVPLLGPDTGVTHV
jgi:sugar/nucleoside kinase (ribokinase family)